MSEKRDILLEALVDAIEAAPERKRKILAEALEDYNNSYPPNRRFCVPVLRDLFGAIEVATMVRPLGAKPAGPCEHCEAPDLH